MTLLVVVDAGEADEVHEEPIGQKDRSAGLTHLTATASPESSGFMELLCLICSTDNEETNWRILIRIFIYPSPVEVSATRSRASGVMGRMLLLVILLQGVSLHIMVKERKRLWPMFMTWKMTVVRIGTEKSEAKLSDHI